MRDDAELLREYAESGTEEAFAELVRRHLGLVYQSALRQVGGDAHLAQDVAQSVFADLARKAASLRGRTVLAGWLYTSARYAAVQVVRSEQRRRKREDVAMRLSDQASADGEATDWERLRPVIDDALHGLGERDREAVLLRFFEGRAFAEIGRKLAVSEDAARMRVERALEKLRGVLVRRGVISTSAALAIALTNPPLVAVPAGLAVSVTGGALAGGAAAAAGTFGWVTFMGMTKLQVGVAVALLAGGATGFWFQKQVRDELHALRIQVESDAGRVDSLTKENDQLRRETEEMRELKKDDVELARLEQETAVLKAELAANVAARARMAAPIDMDRRVFKLSEIDVIPKMKERGVPPVYPSEMRNAGVEGSVVLRFVVDADGKVQRAEAVKASHEAFAEVALKAVDKWAFEAGRKGDVPVSVQMMMPMIFTLQKEDGLENNWF